MTPAARLSAAIEVIADIEARRRPAADALKDWGLSHRFAGSGDRAAIAGLVFDALRRRASSAHIMGEPTPARGNAGHAAARAQARLPDAIAALADGARFAPAPLSARGARAARRCRSRGRAAMGRRRLSAMARSVSRPRRSGGSRRRGRGARQPRPARSAGQRAQGRTRQGRRRRSRISILRRHVGRRSGLRIVLDADAKSPAIHAEPAFIKGMVEVQDEGSQLAALLCGAKAGRAGDRSLRGRGRQDARACSDDGKPRPNLRDGSRTSGGSRRSTRGWSAPASTMCRCRTPPRAGKSAR